MDETLAVTVCSVLFGKAIMSRLEVLEVDILLLDHVCKQERMSGWWLPDLFILGGDWLHILLL